MTKTMATTMMILVLAALWMQDASAFTLPHSAVSTISTPTGSVQRLSMSLDDANIDEATEAEIKVDDDEIDVDALVAQTYELLADVDDALKTSPKEAKEAPKTDPSEVSWSELFSSAADAAATLGEAAVKKATDVVGDLNVFDWEAPKKVVKADVSIEYDAAARFAYQKWQEKYGSGGQAALPPSEDDDEDAASTPPVVYSVEERFVLFFQKRYNNVTIQNVIEKKKERDGLLVDENGTAIPMELLSLNKYADLSPDEYDAVMKSLEPKSWGEIFGGLANSLASSASALAETVKDKATTSSAPIPTTNVKSPVKRPSVSTTTSVFGSLLSSPKSTPKSAAPTKKKAAPVKRTVTSKVRGATAKSSTKTPPRATISLFAPKKKAEAKKAKKAKVSAKTTTTPSNPFSFFGGGVGSAPKKAANGTTKAAVPTLTNWMQNPDGSITGRVANSPNFRNGTKITTSPVRKGVRKGAVIKTGSGSQYKLM